MMALKKINTIKAVVLPDWKEAGMKYQAKPNRLPRAYCMKNKQ
jgi:hypothetical protein